MCFSSFSNFLAANKLTICEQQLHESPFTCQLTIDNNLYYVLVVLD